MKSLRKQIWSKAIWVGGTLAVMEGALILAAEPGIERWHLAQAVLAWFSFGFVLYLSETGLPAVQEGILLTVILNLPWYIAEAIRPKKLDHLLPLIVASIIAGTLAGLLKKRLQAKDTKDP
jgi:hypothetical protein